MKPYTGPTEFKNVRKRYNPKDFMSKHQFDLIEHEDEMISQSASQRSSQDSQNTSERIRLPSGSWILRDTVTGQHRAAFEFDEEQPHISPNQQNQDNPFSPIPEVTETSSNHQFQNEPSSPISEHSNASPTIPDVDQSVSGNNSSHNKHLNNNRKLLNHRTKIICHQ